MASASSDLPGLLLDELTRTLPADRRALRRVKTVFASRFGQPLARNDLLLSRYRLDVAAGRRVPDRRLERLLRLNDIRSQSGLATVTVITAPYACPGRCVYCPTEARAPKSYLPNEPAILRALRSDYDPHQQVVSRLRALVDTGHATDKIELIIKGGTWSFYPAAYQEWFVQRCFEAANEFAGGSRLEARGKTTNHEPRTTSAESLTLSDVQRRNETAGSRLIGITIETRPDYLDEAELIRLRRLGVTRVELGVQSLDEQVLALIVRDHTTAEVRQATRLLREAGFKIAYHLMPNLPGATPEGDLDTMRQLFADPAYRPDAIKLYPCVVIETADLFQWWRDGRYHPYDDQTLIELLIRMKQLAPSFVRIERVIRDIPSTSIRAGSRVTNLRETVLARMRAQGLSCRCIRCRQVRVDAGGSWHLARQAYDAAGGLEIFLSFEDPVTDRLASLLRLRIPGAGGSARGWLPELAGCALIRELHTYGEHLALDQHVRDAAQHQGFGARLVAEAERIAREEFGCPRVAVIAGVGVRSYYRRLGYALEGTYMVKALI